MGRRFSNNDWTEDDEPRRPPKKKKKKGAKKSVPYTFEDDGDEVDEDDRWRGRKPFDHRREREREPEEL